MDRPAPDRRTARATRTSVSCRKNYCNSSWCDETRTSDSAGLAARGQPIARTRSETSRVVSIAALGCPSAMWAAKKKPRPVGPALRLFDPEENGSNAPTFHICV
jgi:hypothetical protein